jgi:hypothetical protein
VALLRASGGFPRGYPGFFGFGASDRRMWRLLPASRDGGNYRNPHLGEREMIPSGLLVRRRRDFGCAVRPLATRPWRRPVARGADRQSLCALMVSRGRRTYPCGPTILVATRAVLLVRSGSKPGGFNTTPAPPEVVRLVPLGKQHMISTTIAVTVSPGASTPPGLAQNERSLQVIETGLS